MVPAGIQVQLLTLAEALSFLLASQFTPDAVRQKCLKFVREFKEILPPDSRNDVDAAEARAVLRAMAYRRDD